MEAAARGCENAGGGISAEAPPTPDPRKGMDRHTRQRCARRARPDRLRPARRAAARALAAAGALLAGAPALADLEVVRACVERNTPRISAVQQLELRVGAPSGVDPFRSRFTFFWRRMDGGERRILVRFAEPEDLDGAAILVHARRGDRPRVHLHLPGQGAPRAITSRGELEGFLGRVNLGTEELELLLDPVAGSRLARLPDAEVGGRPVWVVERREPAEAETRFPRVVSFIDREFCIPLRAELYDDAGAARKRLEVDVASIRRVVQTWLPQVLVFRDLRERSDTTLRLLEAEIDTPFSPALLTVEALPAAAR